MPASRLPSSMPALASRSDPSLVAVLEIVQIGLLQPLTRGMSVFVVVTCHVSRVVFCVTAHSDGYLVMRGHVSLVVTGRRTINAHISAG